MDLNSLETSNYKSFQIVVLNKNRIVGESIPDRQLERPICYQDLVEK